LISNFDGRWGERRIFDNFAIARDRLSSDRGWLIADNSGVLTWDESEICVNIQTIWLAACRSHSGKNGSAVREKNSDWLRLGSYLGKGDRDSNGWLYRA